MPKEYDYIRYPFRYKENEDIANFLQKAKSISGHKSTNKILKWCIKRATTDYQKLAIDNRALSNKYKLLYKKYQALIFHLDKIQQHKDELTNLLNTNNPNS